MDKSLDQLAVPENIYGAIAKKFQIPTSAVVYYPCCGSDDLPASGFPGRRFIFADANEDCVSGLRQKGFEAHVEDVTKFQPVRDGVDVLVLQNPVLCAYEFVDRVKPGGFIICNNYHGSAGMLAREDSMELAAVVHSPRESSPVWSKITNLADYFADIDTDQALADRGLLKYCEEILDKYNARMVGKSVVDCYRIFYQTTEASALGGNLMPDGEIVELKGLPRKERFGLDDLAVFRKRKDAAGIKSKRSMQLMQQAHRYMPEVIEPWILDAFQALFGQDSIALDKESLVRFLAANDFTTMQLYRLGRLLEYFCLREELIAKHQTFSGVARSGFALALECKYGVPGDPAFAPEMTADFMDDLAFFGGNKEG